MDIFGIILYILVRYKFIVKLRLNFQLNGTIWLVENLRKYIELLLMLTIFVKFVFV